jgi:hypothetical protein
MKEFLSTGDVIVGFLIDLSFGRLVFGHLIVGHFVRKNLFDQ